MFEIERLQKIQQILKNKPALSVQELARLLYVSQTTVRRDLNTLEQQGLVKRIHGGAVLITGTAQEVPLYLRERQNSDIKERLAYQAVSYIRNGQVLFLDASSTVQRIAPHLAGFRNLTIITNGLKTAQELSGLSHSVYSTGGLQLHNSSAYVGPYAEHMVRQINADVFFFSSRGISQDGIITDTSVEETQLRRAMFEQSKVKIFLCDSSKFNHCYCHSLCNVDQVDQMISDQIFVPQKTPNPGNL